MPVRKLLPQAQAASSQQEQAQSQAPGLGRRLGRAGAQGAESIPNLLGYLFGEPSMPGYQPEPQLETPQFTGLSGLIQGQRPEQEFAPQSYLENVGQRFLQKAPANLISGGKGLIGAALGSAVGAGLESFGFSPTTQAIGDIATDLSANKLVREIPTLGGSKHAKAGGIPRIYKEQQAKTAAALQQGEKAGNIQPYLEEANKIISKAAPIGTKGTRTGLNQLDRILTNLATGEKTEFLDALAGRREIDSLLPGATGAFKTALLKARDGINNFLKYFNPSNPQFAKELAKEDKIWALNQMVKTTKDYATNWAKGYYGGKIPKPILKLLAKGGEIVSHFAVLAKNDPETLGKYLWNAADAGIKNNAPTFINALKKMEKENEKAPKITHFKKGKVYKVL